MPESPAVKSTNEESTATELASEFKVFEKITLVVNVLLFIVAVFALCVYRGQLNVMQSTLDEMKSSGQGTTNQTWQVIANINWLARSMDDSAKQAQRVLDATINQNRLNQRAWVGPTSVDDFAIQDGKPIAIKVRITNSGKTPALHCTGVIRAKTVPAKDKFVPTYPVGSTSEDESIEVIQPGMTIPLETGPSPPMNTTTINSFNAGTYNLYVFGKISYVDVFGTPHATHYCFVLNPDLRGLSGCNTYNDAN